MADIQQQISDNQTIEKSALIIAGTTLISVGASIVVVPGSQMVGLGVLTLGAILLIAREFLKLKSPNV